MHAKPYEVGAASVLLFPVIFITGNSEVVNI